MTERPPTIPQRVVLVNDTRKEDEWRHDVLLVAIQKLMECRLKDGNTVAQIDGWARWVTEAQVIAELAYPRKEKT